MTSMRSKAGSWQYGVRICVKKLWTVLKAARGTCKWWPTLPKPSDLQLAFWEAKIRKWTLTMRHNVSQCMVDLECPKPKRSMVSLYLKILKKSLANHSLLATMGSRFRNSMLELSRTASTSSTGKRSELLRVANRSEYGDSLKNRNLDWRWWKKRHSRWLFFTSWV
jgi:hypothetical protein